MKAGFFYLAVFFFLIFSFTTLSKADIPEKVFAPYADANITNFDLISAADQTGLEYFTLAFILDEGGCSPAWGGSIPLEHDHMLDEIQTIRSRGGDVIVSFGGSLGVELGTSCETVSDLEAAYQSVIDKYSLTYLDFDIEGQDILDSQSVDLRNKAIYLLQQNNENLKISYTVPVLPSGLVQSGLDLLQNAILNQVEIDTVNIMTMNFGDANAPFPDGLMGQYSIDAIVSTIEQLDLLGLTQTTLGVTPLIGQNQIESEIFYLSDAQVLLDYVSTEERVSLLSMWSMARDNGSCAGNSTALPTCSGIVQNEYDFANLFADLDSIGNQSPDVTITNPLPGEIFIEGDQIVVDVVANDSDGTIEEIEFFLDSTSLGIDSIAPYSFVIEDIGVGSFIISAIAKDNLGKTTTASVNITSVNQGECTLEAWTSFEIYTKGDEVSHQGSIWRAKWWTQNEEPGTTGEFGVWENLGSCNSDGNALPSISIVSPSNGSTYTEGENITIDVDVSDSDGSIVSVEYIINSISQGVITISPFSFNWLDPIAGDHLISAIATDDEGGQSISEEILVTITPDSGGNNGLDCSNITGWNSRTYYGIGDLFTYRGNLYEVLKASRNMKPKRGIAKGYYQMLGECI